MPLRRGPPERRPPPASPDGLLVQPHAPESRALGLVVEPLAVLAHRAESEEVAVSRDRDLVVERLRHLLPEREALLVVGLAGELGAEGQELLVRRPAGPVGSEVD